jgi:MFS family permease
MDQVGPLSGVIDMRLGGQADIPPDWLAMLVASSLFLVSFAPLIFAFITIERRQKVENKNKTRILRDDIVSVPSLVITALVLSLIFALAWAAGSGRFELGQQINILTIIVVVGGFLAIIFVPNMVRAWNDWTERRVTRMGGVMSNGVAALPLSALSVSARGVSYFDSILVRIFAPLSGATQSGFMVAHLLVLLVIVPLSAMGFILAAPFGLIPISLAALIALALGRRWAWVEDDRETASRLQSTNPNKADIKVGFDNDLKDEALLGYASLFVLVPLALYQIQGAMGVFESTSASTGNPFVDWLSFFGAELAKAVPFVDWWEIYNVDVQVPFEASAGAGGEWARHMTFAARAIVDLVIMAALFQAITIWQRSRMQRRLFRTGELNAFDPFTEEEFFERGMHKPHRADTLEPKNAFKRMVEEHVQARRKLNLEPLPYSRERLGELIKRDDPDDLRLGAEWMIQTYDVLAGEPRAQLRQLAQRWRSADAEQRFQSNAGANKVWIRQQKREFERILDGLMLDVNSFRGPQISCLAECLSVVHKNPEFAYARLLSFELLCERATGKSAALLGCHLVKESWPEETRDHIKRRFSVYLGLPPLLYLGQGRMRLEVILALASQYPRQGVYAQGMIREILTGVKEHDGDATVRSKAAALLGEMD